MLESIETKESKILDIMIDYIELRKKYLNIVNDLYKSEEENIKLKKIVEELEENIKLKKTIKELKEQLGICCYSKDI